MTNALKLPRLSEGATIEESDAGRMKHISVAVAGALGIGGTLTTTSWAPPENISEALWLEIGQKFGAIETGVSWWLGDWWKAGHQYGDRFKLVDGDDWKARGLPAYQTCRNAGSIAEAFEMSRRRDSLSFSVHAEVAGIADKARQDALLDEAEQEGLSVRDLRNRVREIRRQANTNVLQFPAGRYGLIYCDPPWRYDYSLTASREIENQYPTMSVEEICALPVANIAADNCMLFMWATNPKLREAEAVLDAWGFDYRTNFVWVKDKIGMGYYARGQHELLLVARRGEVPPPAESERVSSVIYAQRDEHSEKPDEFYGLLERLYPTLPKIELFARRKRHGWAAWGNQVPLAA